MHTDEKHGSIELVIRSMVVDLSFRQRGRSRRIQPNTSDVVRIRSDSSAQPIAIAIELQHRPLERDVFRVPLRCRLSITRVSPAVDCLATSFDTK
ncbi:hypothetical protein A6E15_18000 [Natrinema saccharevitans]|uniref:Uncharacterized protein n=1 Tax=Natrinema saccharevitans TaxID=301967 RepID=A0A1S8ARX4_9EURY|nr:hypothetical protein A6E15_18000 [Natrinema saccharevitans]